MRLHLGQIKVRAAAARRELLRVVEEVEREVEEAGRDRLAIDEQMFLEQVPAARTDEQRRRLFVELILLLAAVERDGAADRVAEVDVAIEVVRPRRRVRVFEVGHEDVRAGVERVDHHLAVDRAGDLTAPVAEVGRRLGHTPLGVADVLRVGPEARQAARVELALPLAPPLEQLAAPGIQLAVQARDEVERLAREDFLVGRSEDLHVGEHAHAGSFVNCASSVEPLSASVSLSGATACVTRSK